MKIPILILVSKGLSGLDYCNTVESPLNSYRQGTRKWRLNGGWPLNRGSS